MNRIARVFPRKTAASPTDALAFFREPTADDFASCIEADISAVHISVTFTWDIPRVEDLYYAWQILGVPVMVGGPAFDDRMGDFAPEGRIHIYLARMHERMPVLFRAALCAWQDPRAAGCRRLEHP